ncbi:hypothetical protein C8J56DRAFT_519291 [Mycena floridula]|nr:hypothetical protein C8J56DRAFT_519291 [Mycena floridula]
MSQPSFKAYFLCHIPPSFSPLPCWVPVASGLTASLRKVLLSFLSLRQLLSPACGAFPTISGFIQALPLLVIRQTREVGEMMTPVLLTLPSAVGLVRSPLSHPFRLPHHTAGHGSVLLQVCPLLPLKVKEPSCSAPGNQIFSFCMSIDARSLELCEIVTSTYAAIFHCPVVPFLCCPRLLFIFPKSFVPFLLKDFLESG